MSDNILRFNKVSHSFMQGNSCVNVLNQVDVELPKNCIAGLIGASGSGKSTFLQLAGLLEKPVSGNIYVNNIKTNNFSNSECTLMRRNSIGFVYQKIYLLPEFNSIENVIIPQRILGVSQKDAYNKSLNILNKMGLKERITHRPANLSGGEQQRVAIARALINEPDVILADEPTGNLDISSSELVSKLLIQNIRYSGASAIIATHSIELVKKLDIIFEIKNGKIKLI